MYSELSSFPRLDVARSSRMSHSEMPDVAWRRARRETGFRTKRETGDHGYVMKKKSWWSPTIRLVMAEAFGINRAKTLIDTSRLWSLTSLFLRTRARSCIGKAILIGISISPIRFSFPESASLTRHRPIDRPVAKSYLRAVEKKMRGGSLASRREARDEKSCFSITLAASSSAPRQNGLWVDVYQCRRRQNRLSTNSWIRQKLKFD